MAYKAKKARRYFYGLSPVTLMILLVLFLIVFYAINETLGIALVVFYLVLAVYYHFVGKKEAEAMIDAFTASEVKMLEKRSMKKLGLLEDQQMPIDPIFLYGPSYDIENLDPRHKWIGKLGKDNKWRYSIMEFTRFRFDETQIYIYFAHVDLANGAIFHEGTIECFYSDINSVNASQVMKKVAVSKWLPRKKINFFENVSILADGLSYSASFSVELDEPSLAEKFVAMRSLIRERKRGFEAC
ncbi:MAG: hypothetical protein LBC41_04515 [Clostridiales bacterium]|jgi:Ca2+/Na+ antiporter|nr:hypothetical protein [Clostridiales bacterium]